MKRRLIVILVLLAALFLGWRGWISSHGEQYLREILDAYNRGQRGASVADIRNFDNGFSTARAEINVSFPGAELGSLPLRNPLLIPAEVRYGPLVDGLRPALMKLEIDSALNDWLKPDARRRFEKEVEGNVTLNYRGVLDWSKNMHEKITVSKITARDPQSGGLLSIDPIHIQSDYALETLVGKAVIRSWAMRFTDPRHAAELNVSHPIMAMEITEFNDEGPIFGRMLFQAEEISTSSRSPRAPSRMRFGGRLGAALLHSAPQEASVEFMTDLHTQDPETIRNWKGLQLVKTALKIRGLGLQGLEDLAAMQKRRQELQIRLARASAHDDDLAMQKTILALQALDDDWVKIYNDLLIPGKTRLILDETLGSDKTSRLKLDLTFTGPKLQGDAMSAMIALMAHMDRLVEGSFELTLEKKLAQSLYPHAVFILDSMVSKNMATLKEGIYHLKGQIKGGKIIINGTKYAPQELVMLILI